MPAFTVLIRSSPEATARSLLVRAADVDQAVLAVQRADPGDVVAVGTCSTELPSILRLDLREGREL